MLGCVGVVEPARHRFAHRDREVVPCYLGEAFGQIGSADDRTHRAAIETVGEVGGCQQGGGRNDHGAELDAGQHRFPQFDLVAEDEEHPHTTVDAAIGEPIGQSGRPFGELGEGIGGLAAVVLDQPKRVLLAALRCQDSVEVVDRPIEVLRSWPTERLVNRPVVAPLGQQKIPRGDELGDVGGCLGHCSTLARGIRVCHCLGSM